MIGDYFTKLLQGSKFKKFWDQIMGLIPFEHEKEYHRSVLENELKCEGNMAVTGQVRSGTCKSDKPEDMGHIGPKNHHNKMNCGTKYDSQKPTVLGSAVKKVG